MKPFNYICVRVGVNNQPMMESSKQINISLEGAREMYKSYGDKAMSANYLKILLENTFTKEELEGKVGFVWEDSLSKDGWYISDMSDICPHVEIPKNDSYKSRFKTKEQALSALAFAQLSHICARYNDGIDVIPPFHVITFYKGSFKIIQLDDSHCLNQLGFIRRKDAEQSLVVNRALWEQYWMITK